MSIMTPRRLVTGVATALLLTAGVAGAQTSTTTSTTTPGTPNTGAGGSAAANILLLGASGVTALLGGAYLARRRV